MILYFFYILISKIQQIKKDELLNEREFYEQVLDVIKEMEHISLTPQTANQLKTALEEIGCMKYEDWKEQKEKNGETVTEDNIMVGVQRADISTAVTFISQLLRDYKKMNFSLLYILEGGEEYGFVQQWLKNSKEKSQNKQNIPYYQATQKQRAKENKIRHQKRKIQTLEKSRIRYNDRKGKIKTNAKRFNVILQRNWN